MLRTQSVPLSNGLDVYRLAEVTTGDNLALAAQQERLLLVLGAADLKRLITIYNDASEPVGREDHDALSHFWCMLRRMIHGASLNVHAARYRAKCYAWAFDSALYGFS